MTPTRDEAWHLLNEYTKSESLLKHALAVEAAVRGYARKFAEDEEDGHRRAAPRFRLRALADTRRSSGAWQRDSAGARLSEWMIRAILSHAAEITGVARESASRRRSLRATKWRIHHRRIARAAEQERSRSGAGFGGEAHEGQSVRPRRQREDLRRGAEELGLPLEEHIANVIAFMRERAEALGLKARCDRRRTFPDLFHQGHRITN